MANVVVRQFRRSVAHTLRRTKAESGRKTENVSLRKSGMSSVPDELFAVVGEFKRRGRRWAGWGRVFLTLTSWISGCSPSPWKPWILLLELLLSVECQPYMHVSLSLRALFKWSDPNYLCQRERGFWNNRNSSTTDAAPSDDSLLLWWQRQVICNCVCGPIRYRCCLYIARTLNGVCLLLIHDFKLFL